MAQEENEIELMDDIEFVDDTIDVDDDLKDDKNKDISIDEDQIDIILLYTFDASDEENSSNIELPVNILNNQSEVCDEITPT